MTSTFTFLLFLLLLNNLLLLASDRIENLHRLLGIQGFLLAGLLFCLDHVLMALAIILIKGIGLPMLLWRTYRHIGKPSTMKPHLSMGMSVLSGIICLVFSLWMEKRLPMPQDFFPAFLLPIALTMLFCGLVLVVVRASALVQVMGYLVAENGIFLLGSPLMSSGAIWFELTLLLDLFVAVFVMGIAINHISSKFETIDVGRFHNLRD